MGRDVGGDLERRVVVTSRGIQRERGSDEREWGENQTCGSFGF